MFRKRKQKPNPPPRSDTVISTISNSEGPTDGPNGFGFHGHGDIIRSLPSYNTSTTATFGNAPNRNSFHGVANGHAGVPLEEAPPPYDSVLKDQQPQQQQQQDSTSTSNTTNLIPNQDINSSEMSTFVIPGVHRHSAARNTLPGPGGNRVPGGVNRNQGWRGGSSRHASVPADDLQSFVSGLQQQPLNTNHFPQVMPHLVNPYAVRNYVPDPTANSNMSSRNSNDDSFLSSNNSNLNRSARRSLPRQPGIYPDGPHRTQGRPKLGTNALSKRGRRGGGPRNYMNQPPHTAVSGLHSPPQSESYDSDSTMPPEHIYETLNLPSDSDRESHISPDYNRSLARGNRRIPRDFSSHSVDALFGSRIPQSSSRNNLNSDRSTSIAPVTGNGPLPPNYGRNPADSYNTDVKSRPNEVRNPVDNFNSQVKSRPTDLNVSNNNINNRRQSVGMPYNGSIQSPGGLSNNNFIPMQFLGSASTSSPPLGSVSNSSLSSPPPVVGVPSGLPPPSGSDSAFTDSASSGYSGGGIVNPNSSQNKHLLSPPSHPLQGGNTNKSKPIGINNKPPHATQQQHRHNSHHNHHQQNNNNGNRGRFHSRNDSSLSQGSGGADREQVSTPDSQSHLLPSSNNSSFDQSQIGRSDPNVSGVVFLPDMEDTLLNPTSV